MIERGNAMLWDRESSVRNHGKNNNEDLKKIYATVYGAEFGHLFI